MSYDRLRDIAEFRMAAILFNAFNTDKEPTMPSNVSQFFTYAHLSGALKIVSKNISTLALWLEKFVPDSAEKSTGMRKLLEAKDCFVRAALGINPEVLAAEPEPNVAAEPISGRTFSWALVALKNGAKVARAGWNGRGMWIKMQRPTDKSMMTLPYLYMKTADDQLVPWLISQTDALASDWELVQ